MWETLMGALDRARLNLTATEVITFEAELFSVVRERSHCAVSEVQPPALELADIDRRINRGPLDRCARRCG